MSKSAKEEDDFAGMTFAEIAAKHGEEVAIEAGIAADPDARELTKEDFARMRPVAEAAPHIVRAWRRSHGKPEVPAKEQTTIRLDADLIAHFRASGPDWQTRINDTLRQAVFGSADAQ